MPARPPPLPPLPPGATHTYKKALAACGRHRWWRARAWLDQLLYHAPQHRGAWLRRAEVHCRLRQYPQAQADLRCGLVVPGPMGRTTAAQVATLQARIAHKLVKS